MSHNAEAGPTSLLKDPLFQPTTVILQWECGQDSKALSHANGHFGTIGGFPQLPDLLHTMPTQYAHLEG